MRTIRCVERAVRRTGRRFLQTPITRYGWDPVSNPAPEGPWRDQVEVHWPPFDSVTGWWETLDIAGIEESFASRGYAVVPGIIPESHLAIYKGLHDRMHSGEIDATSHRHDLGGHKEAQISGKENVGQIMWPSDLVKHSRDGPLHERAFAISRHLHGHDMGFDFDMLIFKDAKTDTETPWHQDEAYWPAGMTDKRAITVWAALDEATIDNGAMWMIAGSHLGELRRHRTASEGSHILMTDDASEAERGATCVPLPAGSAVLWHGRTCHYSRGNVTPFPRRTFITNFRPHAMVRWERENGFDHLRKGFGDYDSQRQTAGDVYSSSSTSSSTIKSSRG
eukprot:Hpha_TRINITY_DN22497_c0_g1::TRINITY_DN22497_c0_g1_i1::g.95157::m.95157